MLTILLGSSTKCSGCSMIKIWGFLVHGSMVEIWGYMVQKYCQRVPSNVQSVAWLKSGVSWFKNIVRDQMFRVFHGWNLQPHPHLHHSAPHRWKYVIMYFNTRETTQSRTNVIFHSCTWPPVLSTCKRWKPLTWLLVLWLRLRWCRCWCWWCCRC